jgi:hypothetical protein
MALRVDAAFFVSNQISISGATLFRFPRWVRDPALNSRSCRWVIKRAHHPDSRHHGLIYLPVN